MKKAFMIIGLAAAFASQAADYTLDFRAATPVASEAPVLRKAEIPLAVGQIPSVAVGDTITLTLFDDVAFALKVVSAPPAGIAGQSFIAKDENGSASAIVKVTDTTARISVDDFANRRQYTVRCKDGKVLIVERDNSQADGGECGTCGGEIEIPQPVVEETTTTSAKKSRTLLGASSGAEFPLAEQKSVVDILVAFDKGAKAWAENGSNWGNGGDSIEEFADYAVNKMNTVLANSQLDDQFCYRLVGVIEIDGSWSAIDNDLLLGMRAREGAFSKLSQLRDKYGADTITLLVNRTTGNTSGIGFEYGTNQNTKVLYTPSQFDGMNYACNVCDINTVYSRYTMSHETGHNMGCGHSNRQGKNSGPGRYPDSCGYHFTDANNVLRSTVMAYTYTGDNDGYYYPVPYFSSPDISPAEYGCAVGVEGVNNNRGTLLQTHADIAGLRDRKLPYDWDVRFLDDNGKDIADGALFYGSTYVTLTNANPEAEIYYTLDGTTPTSASEHVSPGESVYVYLVYGSKTLTACAVVDGKAQSVRSITLHDGHPWSGDENGAGLWLNGDSSVRPWNGEYFYNGDAVMFPDLAGVSCATVTVKGAVAPSSVSFSAINTAYTFDKGDDAAQITIPDANFAPAGDVTFNVPVQLSATTFTNMTGCALAFNAPFGQTVDLTGGTFEGMVNIGPYGTLTVAPGVGKTQTLEKLNNIDWYAGTSTFRVGEGKVVFSGEINGGAGVIGRTKLEVGNGGELVFNKGGGTGFNMDQTSLTIEKGGVVTFNDMEHLRRALHLSGGTINAKRLDLVSDPGVYVTDDSSIENNDGGYILIRNSDSEINVYNGTYLTLNVGTQTNNRSDTSGWGIIKRGSGMLVANVELKHSGVTDIEGGSLEVGYSSGSTIFGLGWIVAEGSTLKVKSGCTLKTPTLTLDSSATICVPAAASAPIIATNNVSVSGVYFELEGADNLADGASYPLLKGNDGISGSKDAKTSSLPALASGLKWKLEVADNTLYAKVVEKSALDGAVAFTSNDPSLALVMPSDATLAEGGGVEIAASPIVVNGLSTKAVSIAVKFDAPETVPSTYAAICSWKLGDYVIYCIRETDGKLNCRWGDTTRTLQTTLNQTNSVVIAAGEHLLQVGYYSNGDNGGTRVLLDGKVAYVASGLKFSSESVSCVTFGASAEDSQRYPYAGLVVKEVAVLDVLSSEPAPRMTDSGGVVAYSLNVPGVIPRVFPLTPSGAIALDETVVEATFAETPSEATVSVMASFPADSVGTVCGMWVKRDTSAASPVAIQAEYDGAGKFYIRFNDNSLASEAATRLAETALDVSKPHLYTLTFKAGEGATLYQDGVALLKSESAFSSYSASTVVSLVTFGCGPYHLWRGSAWHDYPNPAKDFSLYASHIALGTSDRTVSEAAVMASMATDEEDDDPKPPETPATIDVLVAYDNGAQTYVANKGVTLSEFAQTQIGKMNDVLVTNKLDRFYSYRLVGVCKVDGVYDNIDTAPALIAAGTGAAVSLRAAREIYGADTVTLLVDVTGNTLGNSSPLNSPDNVVSQHECAFSVCSIRAVDTGKQHTMIHENAHNMGCGHARAQSIINSPFEYGRGFYFKDGNVTRHTIMAYGGDNDASWYFSTTSKEFGFTLGDKTNNNTRVLKETCGEVAKWREGAAIDFDGVKVDGVTWKTSALYPWTVEGDTIRSYNQIEYGNQCTTPLKTTVEGPKVLSFKHKSYFGGKSVAGNNYSHFDVLLDDSPVFTQTECTNSWTDAFVVIPDGTHEVTFVFSQRFAMNNSGDYKDGAAEADDAVWLKDIAFADVYTVDCPHSSTSDNVEWTFPYNYEAKELEGNLDGLEVGTKGIVETLDFGSTNAVVLSVLAELPEEEEGALMGLLDVRALSKHPVYAYANGDGTITIYYDSKTNTASSVTSQKLDISGLHIWTLAYYAEGGARFYMDGNEVASDLGIKWTNNNNNNNNLHTPAEHVTFGSAGTDLFPLAGMKIYAVHSDFGANDGVFNAVSSSVDKVLSLLGCLSEYADESQATKLALLRIYKDTGSVIGEATGECVLRISEIMPKPTDDRTLNGREGMDVNGLESGWVEVENTSDQWADLKDYKFIRTNRSKANSKGDYGNFPSYLVPPYSRAIFYTSERYSNSASMKDSAWATADANGAKPKLYGEALGNVLVWPDKVNPKKSPFVRLIHTPSGVIADTVVVPSDVPEGYSIIVGEVKESLATERWLCPTPTRGKANAKTDGLTRIGPNVGPLYENKTVDKKGKEVVGAKHDSANEFARVAPPAKSGEAYEITFSFNPVMSSTEAAGFRDEDEISSITLVYRAGLTGAENEVAVDMDTDNFDPVDWGHTYKAEIPADKLPGAGQLVQWKFRATDASGNEWTSPSFNNPDDGYEWYGTIVEAPGLESATLPTWHMFATGNHLTQMDVDANKQNRSLVPNQARIAIYDSSTSNYYDYVRIDLRGHTSASFTKKGHGLRFAKAHPLTMRDCVTGEEIEEIRKTSLISEFADPSFMRQMIAFWLWRKMGNLVPFDFPVRCNLNGEFYQLAFNSERFTDELIEDVYGLDKFGYGYKNVGTLKSGSGTTAGDIEKKTPDDEDESNITVLQSELRSKITAAQDVSGTSSAALSSSTTDMTGLDNAELTKFVVQKFDLPAWLNYLASAKITQEMDDVWANICIYYDNPDMLDGARGTGTWMPLGYDFNVSFGQYYQGDIGSKIGLMSDQDWFKSHPFYGGNRVRCWKQEGMTGTCNNGNDGFESVWQSAKFRRLYLRRLRTLMDQELKEPGTPESEVPFMAKMREMADLMRADSALDLATWPDDNSDNAIDIWPSGKRPGDMDAGIDEIWNDYVVPRREHLYVTHSVTNAAKAIGYGSNLNAGIPEAQSPISVLAQNFVLAKLSDCVVISNLNNEVVDMSGWTLKFGVEWTLPAGTVCDSNDCIYVVADRRAFIETHNAELTDQVIVGNAEFADRDVVFLDSADGYTLQGVATDGMNVIVFDAKSQDKANEMAAAMPPQLTAEDVGAGLEAQYLMVVAEPVDGKEGEYKAVVAVNPETVSAPVIAEPAAESEPVEIEEVNDGETTVSVSISNAVMGLWYGYEVADELGESADFINDVDSFERASGPSHTVKGSSRTQPRGFFRVKVLPSRPSK